MNKFIKTKRLFLCSPREDLAKKVKPTSWQDMTPPDFGHVVHLGNATYDKFVKNHVRFSIVGRKKLFQFIFNICGDEHA